MMRSSESGGGRDALRVNKSRRVRDILTGGFFVLGRGAQEGKRGLLKYDYFSQQFYRAF